MAVGAAPFLNSAEVPIVRGSTSAVGRVYHFAAANTHGTVRHRMMPNAKREGSTHPLVRMS
ncbi:hypothetical protein NXC24_PB00345 (plasmid) [Rhizobium sp. NXC24]|nr:hypothetical protein NXC24_PB00345 [Rhizobium sp. NXC24]